MNGLIILITHDKLFLGMQKVTIFIYQLTNPIYR